MITHPAEAYLAAKFFHPHADDGALKVYFEENIHTPSHFCVLLRFANGMLGRQGTEKASRLRSDLDQAEAGLK